MRVALIQTPTAPLDLAHTGGLEVTELNELRGLRQRGIETNLYAAKVIGELEGVHETRDLGWQNRLLRFYYYARLGRRERRADILHGHYTPILALMYPCRSVVHFQGMAVHEPPLYRHFARRCHQAHLVFCARWVRDHHRALYPAVPEEHRHVVHNGVDERTFAPPATPRPEGEKTKLVFYGGWLPSKGIYELLRAAALLESKRQDFELHFGGSAFSHYRRPESEEIDRRVREMAEPLSTVKLIGHIPHEQLPALLQTMDIGVVPSTYEDPFPLVPLEMMACGLPVVAFAVGGLKEALLDGQTGFLVENRNVAALARALETLIDNHQLRLQMGANARRHVEQHFTWDRHVDQLLTIYEQIIRRNRDATRRH